MEEGRWIITLLTLALAITTWYSFLRYKRQFDIAMWLAWIILVLNVVDIVFTLNGWAIFNAVIMVLVIVGLQVEKKLREAKEAKESANAEENADQSQD